MANKKQKLLLPLVKNKNKFTCFDIKENQISIIYFPVFNEFRFVNLDYTTAMFNMNKFMIRDLYILLGIYKKQLGNNTFTLNIIYNYKKNIQKYQLLELPRDWQFDGLKKSEYKILQQGEIKYTLDKEKFIDNDDDPSKYGLNNERFSSLNFLIHEILFQLIENATK